MNISDGEQRAQHVGAHAMENQIVGGDKNRSRSVCMVVLCGATIERPQNIRSESVPPFGLFCVRVSVLSEQDQGPGRTTNHTEPGQEEPCLPSKP